MPSKNYSAQNSDAGRMSDAGRAPPREGRGDNSQWEAGWPWDEAEGKEAPRYTDAPIDGHRGINLSGVTASPAGPRRTGLLQAERIPSRPASNRPSRRDSDGSRGRQRPEWEKEQDGLFDPQDSGTFPHKRSPVVPSLHLPNSHLPPGRGRFEDDPGTTLLTDFVFQDPRDSQPERNGRKSSHPGDNTRGRMSLESFNRRDPSPASKPSSVTDQSANYPSLTLNDRERRRKSRASSQGPPPGMSGELRDSASLSNFKKAEESGANICVCAAAKYSERDRVQVKQQQERLKTDTNKLHLKTLEMEEDKRKYDRMIKECHRKMQEVRKSEHYCDERQRLLKSFEETLAQERSKTKERSDALKATEASLNEERKHLGEEQRELEGKLKEVNKREAELSDRSHRYQMEEESVNARSQSLAARERQADEDLQELEDRMNQLKENELSIRSEMELIEDEKEDLKHRQHEVELQRKSLEANHQQKLDELQFREGLLEQQELENQTTLSELDDRQAAVDQKLAEHTEAQSQLTSEQRQLATDQRQLETEQRQLAADEVTLANQNRELTEWRTKEHAGLKEWESRLKELEGEIAQKSAILETERIKMQTAKQAIRADEDQLELEKNEWETTMTAEEVAFKKKEIQFKREADDLHAQWEEMAAEREELDRQRSDLDQRSAAMEARGTILDDEETQNTWIQEVKKEVEEERRQLKVRQHQVRVAEDVLGHEQETRKKWMHLEHEKLDARAAELKAHETYLLRLERTLQHRENGTSVAAPAPRARSASPGWRSPPSKGDERAHYTEGPADWPSSPLPVEERSQVDWAISDAWTGSSLPPSPIAQSPAFPHPPARRPLDPAPRHVIPPELHASIHAPSQPVAPRIAFHPAATDASTDITWPVGPGILPSSSPILAGQEGQTPPAGAEPILSPCGGPPPNLGFTCPPGYLNHVPAADFAQSEEPVAREVMSQASTSTYRSIYSDEELSEGNQERILAIAALGVEEDSSSKQTDEGNSCTVSEYHGTISRGDALARALMSPPCELGGPAGEDIDGPSDIVSNLNPFANENHRPSWAVTHAESSDLARPLTDQLSILGGEINKLSTSLGRSRTKDEGGPERIDRPGV